MLDWWELPGPSRFLRQVAGDLSSGVNVICELPDHLPDGFYRELRHALPLNAGLHLERLRMEPEDDRPPIETLFARYLPDVGPDMPRTAYALAASLQFGSQVVWVEGMTAKNWPLWGHFLKEYQHACHALRDLTYATFFAPLPRTAGPCQVAPSSPALRTCRFFGALSLLDMTLYVSERLPPELPCLDRDTMMVVIANVALWDAEIADRLLDESLDRVFAPEEVLRQIALERGWDSPPDPQWAFGARDELNGIVRTNSAWCALRGPSH